MSQELMGLEYLQKWEIINKKCDMEKPFAFISYSHDEFDSQIVRNAFIKLYENGINVWIDTANMPINEDDWKVSAMRALMNHNCKFAYFFRSESSLFKDTISRELNNIKKLKHIEAIVTIDIWHQKGNNANKILNEALNSGDYTKYEVCEKICDVVSPGCNAIRLHEDYNSDVHDVVTAMILQAKKYGLGSDVEKVKVEFSASDKAAENSDKEEMNSAQQPQKEKTASTTIPSGKKGRVVGRKDAYNAEYCIHEDGTVTVFKGSKIKASQYTPVKYKEIVNLKGILGEDITFNTVSTAERIIKGVQASNGQGLIDGLYEKISEKKETSQVEKSTSKDLKIKPISAQKKESPKETSVAEQTNGGGIPLNEFLVGRNDKNFTAKIFSTIGLSVKGHPEYDIFDCPNMGQLYRAFIENCLRDEGEAYIKKVNKINETQKSPVFGLVKDVDAGKYKQSYGATLAAFPNWKININYSPFGFLKQLEKRIIERGFLLSQVLFFIDSDTIDVASLRKDKPVNTIDPETEKLIISGERSLSGGKVSPVKVSSSQGSRNKDMYSLDGETFNKRKLGLYIIKDYVAKHPDVTYEELVKVFDIKLKFDGKSLVRLEETVTDSEKKASRVYWKEPIKLGDGKSIVVSTQWMIDDMDGFHALVKPLGYDFKLI